MKYYVLYNPQAGNGSGATQAKEVETLFENGEFSYVDVTSENGYSYLFSNIQAEDGVIVCGGDGTLNRFANATRGKTLGKEVWYYACGTGNDFFREVEQEGNKLVNVQTYLQNLPEVTVNGESYVFINGVGYGIDGYCCEVGDEMRGKSDKPVNYTAIAIKGLLFHYKPTNATVVVDGKEYQFKKVWIAPTMNGKYYGGGMMPAPQQDRKGDKLSVMVFHDTGKLKTLMIFPSLFKGEHVKHTKYVTVLEGKEITVQFDAPRPLQIDGETVLGVTEYTAKK